MLAMSGAADCKLGASNCFYLMPMEQWADLAPGNKEAKSIMCDPSAIASPSALEQDLDRLAGQGAAQMSRNARLHLASEALLTVLPIFPIAAIGAVAGVIFGMSAFSIGLIGLGMPLVAFLALAGWRIFGFHPGRGEALGWIDREAALKGRMRAADSFLALPEVSAFEQAAIIDAVGYLPSAVQVPGGAGRARFHIPVHAFSIALCSVLVSLAAMVMAIIWSAAVADWHEPDISPVNALANALNIRDGMSGEDGSDGTDSPLGDAAGASPAGGSLGGEGARSEGEGGAGSNLAPDSGSGSSGAAGAADAGAAANRNGSAGSRSADPATDIERAGRSGAGARDGRGASDAQDAQSGGESADGNAGEREATPIASANAGVRAQAKAARSSQARKGGEDGNRAPQRQSREGSQSQSQPGRGRSAQSGNGSNSASAEQKSSFGVSGLLLGVPMADQLTGTRNPGPARRRTVEGEPGPASATGTQAQARGAGSGRTGTQPQPTRSARETRLLSNWYARGGRR